MGVQPAQRCQQCTAAKRRPNLWWVGSERKAACPRCGGELTDTREPRQISASGFATRRDAELARAKDLQRLGRGSYVPPERMTLAEYLRDRWLPSVQASSRLKQTTKEGYARHVKYHLIGPAERPHTVGLLELRKLNLATIRTHYAELAEGYWAEDVLRNERSRKVIDKTTGQPKRGLVHRQGLSTQTLRRVHACLHGALAAAVELGMLDHNPASRAAKHLGEGDHVKPEPPAWSEDELWKFLDSQVDSPTYPLWHLLAMTGMRRGEALALRWSDVRLKDKQLTVRQNRVPVSGGQVVETSTKKRRVRVVDLDADTVKVLTRLKAARSVIPLTGDDSHVFTDAHGQPLNPNSVTHLFRKAVGKSDVRYIPLHGLRHTHLSLLVRRGVPISVVCQRAGHANPNITLGVYTHCLSGEQAQAVKALRRRRK